LRILFLETSTTWSGSARAFFAAGRALGARGYEVTFACAPRSLLEAKAREAGLSTIAADPASGVFSRALLVRRALLVHFLDVVFVQGERDELAASLAMRITRRGAIVRRWPAGVLPHRGWQARAGRKLGPMTHLLTAVSPDAVPPAIADTAVRGEPGVELPPAARDPIFLADGRSAPRLVCITSRGSRRRLLNVMRSVSMLSERHPRVQLAVVGEAMTADELRLYAAALNIARSVELVGDGGADEALRAAAAAWVVAEGDEAAFGCLDAMARGVPVFAERSAITERFVTDGVHGELFAALQPAEMAAATAVLAAQPARRAAFARAARERVEREFTEREMANGFEQATRLARDAGRVLTREQA
jgi:glycosyltransferase involved in cell wall biosynthesis